MTDKNLDFTLGISYTNPAPLGVTVKSRIERGDPYSIPIIYNIQIAVLEIIRGKEAGQLIQSQGAAEEPAAGYEFLLARVKFDYYLKGRKQVETETYKLSQGQFMCVSSDGKTQYEMPKVIKQPEPQLIDLVISPGDSKEGLILLQVPTTEQRPLLLFKREHNEAIYGIFGYLWFQLF